VQNYKKKMIYASAHAFFLNFLPVTRLIVHFGDIFIAIIRMASNLCPFPEILFWTFCYIFFGPF